ncbi:MAG: tRNA lysidine(34) synthetase TilS [Dysgonamonadaceae bacterium]|nr:tRNA lysidine(34) synthetase TilS [Dysgonamonadaceae bacterium]
MQAEEKVIVGVSGGADSVVLLDSLHKLGYNCIAAHCNFNLRGDESERDKNFSEVFAKTLQIPFLCKSFNTLQIAKEKKISVEMAARNLRYEWFEEIRCKEKADAIAVAHHSDDSIETFILNMIRGTGIHGLTGIKPKNNNIIRPLLCLSKAEIMQYAEQTNLNYVTDSTNLEDEFTRNKIRNQIVPLLETINPSVKNSILNTSYNIAKAAKIYDHAINDHIHTIYDKEKGTINIPLLKKCPSPHSVIYEIIKDLGFSSKTIADICKSIDSQSGKTFYSLSFRIIRDRNEFVISPLIVDINKEEYLITDHCNHLKHPLEIEIFVTENKQTSQINHQKNIAVLDFDKLQFPLVLRRWRTGDRFVPFGMSGFQKLSDFFNNNKVNHLEKETVWVLVSGENIAWIVNHRIDNRFRIEKSTVKILKLRVKN